MVGIPGRHKFSEENVAVAGCDDFNNNDADGIKQDIVHCVLRCVKGGFLLADVDEGSDSNAG